MILMDSRISYLFFIRQKFLDLRIGLKKHKGESFLSRLLKDELQKSLAKDKKMGKTDFERTGGVNAEAEIQWRNQNHNICLDKMHLDTPLYSSG